MNLFTLIENIKDILISDTTLSAWLTANYSASLNVFGGVDNRKPPGREFAPFAVLMPEGRYFGDGVQEKEHSITLRLALENENTTHTGNYIEQDGLKDLTVFLGLAIDALRNNLDSIGLDWLGPIRSKYDAGETFPLWFVDVDINLTEFTNTTDNIFD